LVIVGCGHYAAQVLTKTLTQNDMQKPATNAAGHHNPALLLQRCLTCQ
jgi:hypothetical protein